MFFLNKIAEILHYNIITPDIKITNIKIDSKQIKHGDLFIALHGKKFDGHDFIPDAIKNGAVAVISEKLLNNITIPQLIVESTLLALTNLAKYYRQTLNCKVIALTGSNGKTTVKEMIANILPHPSYASYGNFNNHIGVPLNVMQMSPEQQYAVFELGANHLGEIAHTVDIVKPHVALINNIAPAHIEGFGSIDGVAKAKGEIYQGLLPNGIAIINNDDQYAHFWDEILKNHQIIKFSLTNNTEIHASNVTFNSQGCAIFTVITPITSFNVHLKVAGSHNINNALAAIACCYALNIDIDYISAGLHKFTAVKGRLNILTGKNNITVIDDTYNANLQSVLTAIKVLAARNGKKMLILGDMGELGGFSEQHHAIIGYEAKQNGIDMIMTCGTHSKFTTLAFGNNAKHYETQENLINDLQNCLDNNMTVLIKGSRSAAMEKVVQQIMI